VVLGIDGGEWKVIRHLWEEGKLPHLKALADRGVTASLATNYTASPVIWTTIATGRRPKEHGITDFVVSTPQGDVPVSSTLRQVPALWNMLTKAKRKVAVLGWWATWPAETVHGVILSDRSLLDLKDRISPPELMPQLRQEIAADLAQAKLEEPLAQSRPDRIVSRFAPKLAAEDFDLLMVYLRGPDIASHQTWRFFEPEKFPHLEVTEEDRATKGRRIADEYEAVDATLAAILEAAHPEPNILVISDHGFKAAKDETVRVFCDFDKVLERLSFLQPGEDGGADLSKSQLFAYRSPEFKNRKMLRYPKPGRDPGGTVGPGQEDAIRQRLEQELSKITFAGGHQAFTLRDPRPREVKRGADLIVDVQTLYATPGLSYGDDQKLLAGVVRDVSRLSGTHTTHTDGIILAAGPDIDPDVSLEGIRIHDMAPTILYALGLPVADNFAGRAWTELFQEDFRQSHPLRTIPSWNLERAGEVTATEDDEELIQQLRSLGYL